jgi:hypothetical protein
MDKKYTDNDLKRAIQMARETKSVRRGALSEDYDDVYTHSADDIMSSLTNQDVKKSDGIKIVTREWAEARKKENIPGWSGFIQEIPSKDRKYIIVTLNNGRYGGVFENFKYEIQPVNPDVSMPGVLYTVELTEYQIEIRRRMRKAFPNAVVEIARGDRLLVDGHIIKGLLVTDLRNRKNYEYDMSVYTEETQRQVIDKYKI